HANIVVEAGLAPQSAELLSEDRCQQVFRRRLAVGPTHGDDEWVEVRAITSRQVSESTTRVLHRKHSTAQGCRRFGLLDHYRCDFFLRDLAQKAMAVKVLAG